MTETRTTMLTIKEAAQAVKGLTEYRIRRMCKELGYDVVSLKRIRVLNILLEPLKTGEIRRISGEELRTLYEWAGLEKPIE